MKTKNKDVSSTLQELGFRGRNLTDISTIVKTEDDLEDLVAFIIRNETKYKTSLAISNAYRKEKMGEYSKDEFIQLYESSIIVEVRKNYLENLLKAHVDIRWVLDLDSKIHSGVTTLANFYRAHMENPTLHIKKLITESVLMCNED